MQSDNKSQKNEPIESWHYVENGKIYWQWRHAYRKVLESIISLRFKIQKRQYRHYICGCCGTNLDEYHSIKYEDSIYVENMKRGLNSCQLWLEEMRNPRRVY
jgi:hypothetical protein